MARTPFHDGTITKENYDFTNNPHSHSTLIGQFDEEDMSQPEHKNRKAVKDFLKRKLYSDI